MLTTSGKRIRGVLTASVLVALMAGTVIGDDDHFPFGPFRMYSTTNKLDGLVRAAYLQGVTAEGEVIDIGWTDVGMRRAEVEGQIDRFQANPVLLRNLVTAYERHVPDAPEIVEVRLLQELTRLRGGKPTTSSSIELSSWRAP